MVTTTLYELGDARFGGRMRVSKSPLGRRGWFPCGPLRRLFVFRRPHSERAEARIKSRWMDRDDDALFAWASEAAARTWTGSRVDKASTLRGDLSARRFFRVGLAGSPESPSTAILVDLGPHDLPAYVRTLRLLDTAPAEPPWIEVNGFLHSLGVPVPKLFAAGVAERALLVEDVGDTPLFDVAGATPAHAGDLYRLAVEELLRIHVDGTRSLPPGFIASKIAYDERLFFWELKEFIELGFNAVVARHNVSIVEPELRALAKQLGGLPRVLSHRDYHGWNLLVQTVDGRARVRVIDFQDALMAPGAQDLAVLLTTRDTHRVVTPALERRLLDFYLAGLARRGEQSLSTTVFDRSYRLCVLQHALKMLGRFLWFESNGRPGYARYVPDCLGQAQRMLATELGAGFPQLRESLHGASLKAPA